MRCDIIMAVWNQLEATKRCIESIQRDTRYPYRLILIDNNSGRETGDYLKGLASPDNNITLITNKENLGFIKAANMGLKASDAPYVCLMNNDTVATEGWLGKMVSIAEKDPGIGLVNPKSEDPGKISLADYSMKLARNKGQYLETNQCMGFCMLIKRKVLEEIGYLDEAYGMGGFDDTDFSKRAHLAGYKCVCAKEAYVYHKWHTSFRKAGNREELVKRNEAIFFDRWGKFLRIGYPMVYGRKEDFYRDINRSLGLAREWNWVHAWINTTKDLKREGLTEHQSLRIFHMSGIKAVFYFEVLFRLIERRLRNRKVFDVILVSDRRLFNILSFFRPLFSFPVFYIGKDEFAHEGDEKLWRERARGIVERVKSETQGEQNEL